MMAEKETGAMTPPVDTTGPQPAETAAPTSFIGKVGRVATRLDGVLSERVPEAIEQAGRRSADSARRSIHSGQWQNYVFLIVLALVAITAVMLVLRGCSAGGGLS